MLTDSKLLREDTIWESKFRIFLTLTMLSTILAREVHGDLLPGPPPSGTFLSVEENPEATVNRLELYYPGGERNGVIRTTDLRNRPLSHPYGIAIYGGVKPNYRIATILFKTKMKMQIFFHRINSLP